MNIKHSIRFLIFLLIFSGNLYAQNDTLNIYDLDFTELAKLKIVSASKTEQELKEIPSTILIITAEQIRQNGYFTLEDVLADLPGFQFRNILGINSYVFQRGIPNQNNLILLPIDGIQVNELNSGGFYGGAQYNLLNVDRIEIVSGPSSVAYGTNAVSGIINIITKPATDRKFEIKSGFGSFNTYESYALETSYTRQFGGSGLGLSISKAYVELLGGTMKLESEPDKGSTFYFEIPRK